MRSKDSGTVKYRCLKPVAIAPGSVFVDPRCGPLLQHCAQCTAVRIDYVMYRRLNPVINGFHTLSIATGAPDGQPTGVVATGSSLAQSTYQINSKSEPRAIATGCKCGLFQVAQIRTGSVGNRVLRSLTQSVFLNVLDRYS